MTSAERIADQITRYREITALRGADGLYHLVSMKPERASLRFREATLLRATALARGRDANWRWVATVREHDEEMRVTRYRIAQVRP